MGESGGSPKLKTEEDGELSNDDEPNDLFVVDCQPTAYQNSIDVPVYDKKFGDFLKVGVDKDKSSKPGRPKPPQNTCWNCGGNHSLRECTEPKNYDAINHNRMIFMSKGPHRARASRYHLDEEQRYPHIRAGKISKRLRRALSLQSNQLPRHIYRMRCLGYPPGWVEEAKVSHSGLFLFNSEGQEVADPGFEDGEIVAEGAKDKFDIKKIIEYPGFNCPYDSNIIDEYERFQSKPMAEKDSVKFMKTMWQPKAVKAYKRKKMDTSDLTPKAIVDKKRSLLLLDDMELESDDGASLSEDGEVNESLHGDSESSSNKSNPTQATKRPGLQSPSLNCKKQKIDEASLEFNSPIKDAATLDESDENHPSVQVTPNLGQVTSVILGTPVIVKSPFTCLPSPDKFSKNICDVINFENLPDSTGKYEKMSGLIKKVRTCVTKLSTDDDENSS